MQRSFFSTWSWGGLVIAATWLFLFVAGFPLPFVDDLYFLGPALNLAHGMGYSNPYCPMLVMYDPNYMSEFWVYMPLQGHVLALWIMIFGAGKYSLPLFQCLFGALATLGLVRLMRPSLSGPFFSLMLSLVMAIYLSSCGLRPENLGLALFCWGLLVLRSTSLVGWGLACLSLFATCITSPNLGILVPLVLAFAIYTSFRSESRPMFFRRLGLVIVTSLAIALLFLYLIDFQLMGFLKVFNTTRVISARSMTTMSNYFIWSLHAGPRYMVKFVVQGIVPYAVLFLFLGLAWGRRDFFGRTIPRSELAMIGLGGIVLLIPANSSATGFVMPGFYSLVVCLYFVAGLKKDRVACWCAYAVLLLTTLRANGNFIVPIFSSWIVPVHKSPAALLAELKQTPHVHVYIDSFALRSVYNYQIPPDGLDYNFGNPTLFTWPHTLTEFPADSVVMASSERIKKDGRDTLLSVPVIGFLLPDVPGNPYDCVIARGGKN